MDLKLPRKVESDSRSETILSILSNDMKILWAGGNLKVTHHALYPSLERELIQILNRNQLVRGLEQIEKILRSEEHGISALRKKQGATKSASRISRILIMTDGGSERFYRTCEIILNRHADRVLGLRITESSNRIAQNLFGSEELVKALLVSDKDAVSSILFSLSGSNSIN